jgi:hypothetical protein
VISDPGKRAKSPEDYSRFQADDQIDILGKAAVAMVNNGNASDHEKWNIGLGKGTCDGIEASLLHGES